MRFQAHYEKVLHSHLPRVKKHLDNACIPPIYLTKWWFGCFLDRVPFSLALRVWDVFLLEGESILIAMAFTIMKMHQKTIKRLEMETFMNFIQNDLSENFGFSNDEVMKALYENLKKLQADRVAIPPPPGPNDLPEFPTKNLAPILTRSMMDIRMDIAEIQSRGSRANFFLNLAFPGWEAGRRLSSGGEFLARFRVLRCLKAGIYLNLPRVLPPINHQQGVVNNQNLPKVDITSSESSTPPIDPVHRRYSSEQHHNLEQSSSNGFDEAMERMKISSNAPVEPAYRQQPGRISANRQSFYDNVPPTPTLIAKNASPRPIRVRSNGNSRVQHMPNNITYITVGDMDDVPSPRSNGLSYHHSHIQSPSKRMDIPRFSSTKEKHTMI
ncbi:hypothetical protein L596_028179 [Steinernema carpocapsae]|uniref:Rab-GAP TBC domain-containing protein n=1 Tax=Steinernema carpocapsae TaxID=34508 RepID=A0A4U5LXR1_STECR|nr:hypothetical protein L596_028179 [Steinernema carpocapsae]